MKIYRNSKNDIQVKPRKYGFTCLFFLWHAQEILSSVFQLIDFSRNDEIQTLLLDNIQYFLNDSFERWKNMIILKISLIFCDRLIDFETWWKKSQ